MRLDKPQKLNKGDKVATVSLSWGGAGDEEIKWRYLQGKERLEKLFEIEVVEMPHTLSGTDYLYDHPEARAKDMMDAFSDKNIKGIFSCIGGDDTIRLLPYIDFSVIRNNPKIFLGYSDTMVNHLMCYKAGLSSIYGPAILTDFAENVTMPDYTKHWLKRTLCDTSAIGEITPSEIWTSEYLTWGIENKNISRKYSSNTGYELLQGSGKVEGRLIGGCFETFDLLRGTELFPALDDFYKSILFLETSEEMLEPSSMKYMLRTLGAMGVFEIVKGIIFSKPYNNKYYEEYKVEIVKVLKEYGGNNLPVLYNLSFGHTEPKFCIPYGAMAEIDCENLSFSILESAVI